MEYFLPYQEPLRGLGELEDNVENQEQRINGCLAFITSFLLYDDDITGACTWYMCFRSVSNFNHFIVHYA